MDNFADSPKMHIIIFIKLKIELGFVDGLFQ